MRILVLMWAAVGVLAAADPAAVLHESAAAWNRGDLKAFIESYEDSAETTFVGAAVTRGTAQVLARYQKAYPGKEQMGTLGFSEISVRTLTPELAIVVGRFTLKRSQAGGGDKTGLFSLVMRKKGAGWRIIHDHTS